MHCHSQRLFCYCRHPIPISSPPHSASFPVQPSILLTMLCDWCFVVRSRLATMEMQQHNQTQYMQQQATVASGVGVGGGFLPQHADYSQHGYYDVNAAYYYQSTPIPDPSSATQSLYKICIEQFLHRLCRSCNAVPSPWLLTTATEMGIGLNKWKRGTLIMSDGRLFRTVGHATFTENGLPDTSNGLPTMLCQIPVGHCTSFFTTLQSVLFNGGWSGVWLRALLCRISWTGTIFNCCDKYYLYKYLASQTNNCILTHGWFSYASQLFNQLSL